MRYLITGGSGYLGSLLVAALSGRPDTDSILIADIRPPKVRPPGTGFRKLDVRDAPGVTNLMASEQPDVVVHMAFTVDPGHDDADLYELDVNGTFNVLAGAASAGTKHAMLVGSTMSYGPWPDNPIPISESRPVHGHAYYTYARHSTEADRIAQLWATLHPDRTMTIARLCTVMGPDAENHFIRMWSTQPFFPDFGGEDFGTQFIHQDDATEALVGLLEGKHAGAFNVTGDGTIPWQECARIAGLKVRRVREQSFASFSSGLWRMRVPSAELPPSFNDFFKHPWLASNAKLKSTLGWAPRYNSRRAFESAIGTGDPPPS